MQIKKAWFLCAFITLITGMISALMLKINAEQDFAEYILLREAGIYTLIGDKPVSMMSIYSRKKEDEPIRDGTKIEYVQLRTGHYKKDPRKLWEKWKKHHKLKNKNYCFIEQKYGTEDFLFLINKSQVKETLSKYYELFAKQADKSFDIEKVVSEVEDTGSLFWTHIFKPHIGYGLLFGYGLENVEQFDRAKQIALNGKPKFSNDFSVIARMHMEKKLTLADLPLPTFRIFSDNDAQVAKYKKEREEIQSKYHASDLRRLLNKSFD